MTEEEKMEIFPKEYDYIILVGEDDIRSISYNSNYIVLSGEALGVDDDEGTYRRMRGQVVKKIAEELLKYAKELIKGPE